jgi:hypothetical protein
MKRYSKKCDREMEGEIEKTRKGKDSQVNERTKKGKGKGKRNFGQTGRSNRVFLDHTKAYYHCTIHA